MSQARDETVIAKTMSLADVYADLRNVPGHGADARSALESAIAEREVELAPDAQLLKLYDATDYASLVAAMEHHIERLQAKVPRDNQPAFTRVREGV